MCLSLTVNPFFMRINSTLRMEKYMITDAAISCFISLAETLSFTETAKRLYMTQQGVSKIIAALEEDLGTPLFVRSRISVSLTEAGRLYLEFFSRFSDEFNSLRESIDKKSLTGGNKVSLGVLEWLNIASALEQLHQKKGLGGFPEVVIDMLPKFDLVESFKKKIYDVIITYNEELPAINDLTRINILETSSLLLVRSSHPKCETAASFKDFSDEPFIYIKNPEFSDYVNRNNAKAMAKSYGLHPSVIKLVHNVETAYCSVEVGQGVFISSGLSYITAAGKVKSYPAGKNRQVVCAYLSTNHNASIPMFIKELKKIFDIE